MQEFVGEAIRCGDVVGHFLGTTVVHAVGSLFEGFTDDVNSGGATRSRGLDVGQFSVAGLQGAGEDQHFLGCDSLGAVGGHRVAGILPDHPVFTTAGDHAHAFEDGFMPARIESTSCLAS